MPLDPTAALIIDVSYAAGGFHAEHGCVENIGDACPGHFAEANTAGHMMQDE